MKEKSEAELLHRMAAYCSTTERCVQEIEKKLTSSGATPEITERIISRLVKEKFIDETRFTRSFVHDKLRYNKWGKIKIGYELRKKNIPASLTAEALEQIDAEEYRSILLDLLKNKKKTTKGKDERDRFNKLLRFALGKGFESKDSLPLLKQLFNTGDYADDLE
ncbi:MAG: RecX family transcriptional regulator [Tannerellaceae bacterium]|nr:RecX family transcriptional regulator [Tannerellaceae bacterium]